MNRNSISVVLALIVGVFQPIYSVARNLEYGIMKLPSGNEKFGRKIRKSDGWKFVPCRSTIHFEFNDSGWDNSDNNCASFRGSDTVTPFDISAFATGTLRDVRKLGFLTCGVSQGRAGFSSRDDKGNWSGLDVDICRALAAAIFGDVTKVKYTPLSAKERFTALQSGEIDVLSRNITLTASRDTSLGLNFVGANYYDGQGFMIRSSLGVNSALELSGASICTNIGTTTERNVADYFRSNKMKYELVAFENADEVVAAYDAGRCDVYTIEQSGLYSMRMQLTNPRDHVVLPELISREPLGPVVRQGDDQWFNLVRWTLYAMVNAEEFGITSANVSKMMGTDNPAIKRFLGTEGAFGESLGVTSDWAVNVINSVGNYAEAFERNLGSDTSLKIPRGVNALWSNGGLQFAPPIR